MKYFLIGKGIGGSVSPWIHGEMGLRYSLADISENELAEKLNSSDLGGCNVTIPYKKSVTAYLDSLKDKAALCKVVNTIKREGDKLIGYNTDYYGMEYMIERTGYDLKDKAVLILGGGASKDTATLLCRDKGAKSVDFVSRNGPVNYDDCYSLFDVQVVINATPVGGAACETKEIIDIKKFKNLEAVFDLVYSPLRTPLVIKAQELGLIASGGLSMLVKQALKSEEIWLDKKIGDDITEDLIKRAAQKTANIVLIGMPSSGKTTVGKEIAGLTGKAFFDVDDVIFTEYGASSENIINTYGEEKFREVEKAVVKKLSALVKGGVIATGGGSVLKKENVTALKENGVTFYLDRDAKLLSDTGRPLLKNSGAEALLKARSDKYDSAADYKVKNDEDILSVAKEIVSIYETHCDKRA